MKRLAVLISDVGKGSNLQAIIGAVNSKKISAKIIAVISDTNLAPGLKYARKSKIPIKICASKQDLLPLLQKIKPDFIALAGWKQIILDEVIESYPNRILNLHPGLIPDTLTANILAPDGTLALWNKGLLTQKAIQNFLDKKSTFAGSSIHFLTNVFDFGPVLKRTFVKIEKNDTVETLYTRLKNSEHQIYIEVLGDLTNKPLRGKTVMIIDGGGRGSALCKKYLESTEVEKVLAIPGNDFMKFIQGVETYPNIKTTDIKNILRIAAEQKVDLVDVAQDDAVAVGLTDALINSGINVFGPTQKAGQIEWNKAWSKNFMQILKIPTAKYQIFNTQSSALKFIKSQNDKQWYIKASGLAAGKGAIFAENNKKAAAAIKQMKDFGKAGNTFLVEECLKGEEFSAFAAVNGKDYILLGYAQDHKTVFDGNLGPNTGGMGCSSSPIAITQKIKKQVDLIFNKTAKGLVRLKRPYLGILYLGGIIDNKGRVKIIEFNARWGDPEAQVIIPSIKNDLYETVTNIINGNIKNIKIKKENLYRFVVTAASKGYPQNFSNVIGKNINGFEKIIKNKNINVFGAGIKIIKGKYTVSGGRIFYVMAQGVDVVQARKNVYNALSKISISGNNLHYRRDIGYRDIERQTR